MSWNGGGDFLRTNGQFSGSTIWSDDKANSIKIVATRHDVHDQDLADGINNCLAKDGQNAMSGDLNLGTFDITNGADGVFSGTLTAATLAAGAASVSNTGNVLVNIESTDDLGAQLRLKSADNFRRLVGLDSADTVRCQVVLRDNTMEFAGLTNTSHVWGELSATGLDLQGNTLSNCDVTAGAITGTTIGGKASVQEEINGGTTGQYLTKASNADRDFTFTTLTPSAVADNFQAYLTTDDAVGLAFGDITGWTQQVNTGAAFTFNTSTGVLTVATAGTYQFNCTVFLRDTDSVAGETSSAGLQLHDGTSGIDQARVEGYINTAATTEGQSFVIAGYLHECTGGETFKLQAKHGDFTDDWDATAVLTRFSCTRVA